MDFNDYQDNSRWDYLKQFSTWHHDESIPPKKGIDGLTYIGNFADDFNDAIAECKKEAKLHDWSERHSFDFERAGHHPIPSAYYQVKGKQTIPVFAKIVYALGMINSRATFHLQKPGQMMAEHHDNIMGRSDNGLDPHPEETRRFVIMLDDWHRGQVFHVGNDSLTRWKKGDCITWEWKDMPHSTANSGWSDRPMLIVTGDVTDKTIKLVEDARSKL